MILKIPYSIDDFIVKTVMKKDIVAEGEISFSTSLRIDCNFKGKIKSENGFLIISHTSTITGDISAGTIMIAGKVIGNINATKKVELFSGSEVIGNIKSPRFRMEDDVKFEGECDIFYDDEEQKEAQNA
ncbi:MAG: polymer-forming cytoskeletal protein [Spirochaetia bacterium]|nr:polymer-forming cytoskeletal protein [Spirochaetota bacterium]MCX8096828.1 polymer-forming cytoskeletal protein [Spirochaetota bacterium]MDW8112797.1 polymer-forming cytoskeletal protein [Spirochaetia bacterium]